MQFGYSMPMHKKAVCSPVQNMVRSKCDDVDKNYTPSKEKVADSIKKLSQKDWISTDQEKQENEGRRKQRKKGSLSKISIRVLTGRGRVLKKRGS